MYIGKRKIQAPDHSEGSVTSEALRRGNVVKQYILRTQYGTTIDDGSGAGAPFADAAYRLLRSVQINVGGTLIHVNGHTIGKLVRLFYPALFPQADPTDDAAASETDLESLIPIPFFMPHSLDPNEFGFPSGKADGSIITSWANAEELFDTDADFTGSSIDDPEVELYEHYYIGHGRDPMDFSGLQIRRQELAVDSSGSPQLDLSHLRNGQELRMVLLEAFAGGSGGIRHNYDDDVLTEVRLELNGEDVVEATPFSVLQADNVVDYDLSSRETGVVVAFDAATDMRTTFGSLPVIRGAEKPTLYLKTAKQTGDCKIVATTIAAISSEARRQRARRAA